MPGSGGTMVDLKVWLDANNPAEGAKWTLELAAGLNDAGLITGYGDYDANSDGVFDPLTDGRRAFILDASGLIPEPNSLVLLAVGVLSVRRNRRRN